MLKILSVAIIGVILLLALGSEPVPEKRILFIGNSFTFGGDIPVQVKNIALTSSPSANYHVDMVVRGGTTLEQHLTETNALAKIQEGDWDVVILQDASVMPFDPAGVSRMKRAATVLATTAKQQGADVIYFAHWAPNFSNWIPVTHVESRADGIRIIEQTYEGLAQLTCGRVARVGRLWQLANDAGLDGLYSADDHHSSLKGAYTAALAIAVALGDVDVSTSRWAPEAVPLIEQQKLRATAHALSFDARDQLEASAKDEECDLPHLMLRR